MMVYERAAFKSLCAATLVFQIYEACLNNTRHVLSPQKSNKPVFSHVVALSLFIFIA